MKRIAIKLVIFLLLGAVVNVGVAWGCALTINPGVTSWTSYSAVSPTDSWSVVSRQSAGLSWYSSMRSWTGPHFWELSGKPPSSYQSTPHPSEVLPGWGVQHETPNQLAPGVMFIDNIIVDGRGWPAVTMWSQLRNDGNKWVAENGFMRRSMGPWSAVDGYPRVLPLRPIFPCFITNTIFYAALLWLLFAAPFATRRLIRKRRGRCVRCGYDLTGTEHDVCPECGTT